MNIRFASLCCLIWPLLLTGCIRDRAYHLAEPQIVVPLAAPSDWSLSGDNEHVHTPLGSPTEAVIEFDEQGKQWHCKNPERLCELDRATDIVRNARIETNGKELVVLTYVHGWHYDASERSGDLRNFQMMVKCLNWGNPTDDNLYDQKHPAKYMSQPPICTGMQADESHRYIGIYIAWHGESIQRWTQFLPYASVFTRRNAAGRVAANAGRDGLQQTFLELSKAAKDRLPDGRSAPIARFIIAGHSYGGLIVGRTAAALYAVRMQHAAIPSATNGCPQQTEIPPPFADMVFTINPADNSLRMAELALRFKAVAYPGKASNFISAINCPKPSATRLYRPLLVSIHTPSDPWTSGAGSMAYKIFFGVDQKEKRQMASAWVHRPDPNGGYYRAESPEELRRNTIHRTDSLRNLCYLDQANGYDPVCAGLNDKLYYIKRDTFTEVMGRQYVPKAANPDYSPDPWYHGAFELL